MIFGIFEEIDRLVEYISIKNDTTIFDGNLTEGIYDRAVQLASFWALVNPQYKIRKKVPGIANPQTIMIAGKKEEMLPHLLSEISLSLLRASFSFRDL